MITSESMRAESVTIEDDLLARMSQTDELAGGMIVHVTHLAYLIGRLERRPHLRDDHLVVLDQAQKVYTRHCADITTSDGVPMMFELLTGLLAEYVEQQTPFEQAA
jgi:hypothetical protein